MWNRQTNPRNAEELMIAEYYRRLDEVKNLEAKLQAATIEYAQDLQKHEEYEAQLEKELQIAGEAIKQTDGVLDLHTPMQAYNIEVNADYYLRGYVEDQYDSKEEQLAFLQELKQKTDEELLNWATTEIVRYSEPCITTKQHMFPYCIQVPYLPEPRKYLYDVMFSSETLYLYREDPCLGRWVCCEKEALLQVALDSFKDKIAAVIKRIEEQDE